MTDFKAAVFDLDGTLLDTLCDLGESVNAVLERHGWPVHPMEAYKIFVGDGPKVLLERALPEDVAADAGRVAELATEYIGEYEKRWDAKASPYEGISGLVDGLRDRGMKLAVLSNKPHGVTLKCAEALLGGWRWDVVFGLREGVPKKPDPTGAFEVARELGVEPGECVYFGDTGTDMETAVGAGMYAVGVLWGFREEKELREAGAQLVIGRPEEFLTADGR